jgi:hypothetical protein
MGQDHPVDLNDQIAKMWEQGIPRDQIACQLGLGRDAVNSRLYRAGYRAQGKVACLQTKAMADARAKTKRNRRGAVVRTESGVPAGFFGPPIKAPLVAGPLPPYGERLIWQLAPRMCKYPTADLGSSQRERHRFCGRPRESGYPYCAEHVLVSTNFIPRGEDERRRLQRIVCEAAPE